MKIFISWSGSQSHDIADVLREFLPCMLQGLNVFLSRHDLESGSRWGVELARELEDSSFGILCLTSANQDAPWILFEAGALTKNLEGKACGLLLGGLTPANVSGPLAQFQHRRFNKNDIHKLLRDLNSNLENPLEHEQLTLIFNKWWPDIEARYKEIITSPAEPIETTQGRNEREILEEVLERVRTLSTSHPTGSMSAKLQNKWYKGLLDDILENLSDNKIKLLADIVKFKNAGENDKIESIAEEQKDEIKELVEQGLLTIDEENKIRINKIFTRRYFGKGE